MEYKIFEFRKNLEGEIKRLQKNVTIGEAILLKDAIKQNSIVGEYSEACIYGAMTGDCLSDRARELKGVFEEKVTPLGGAEMSPIESMLCAIANEEQRATPEQTKFAQHIYNAITGGAINWQYFDKEINKLFTV